MLKPCMVLLIGRPGAGKTTLALELATRLNVRHYIDEAHWRRGMARDLDADDKIAQQESAYRLGNVAAYLTAYCGAGVITAFDMPTKLCREYVRDAVEYTGRSVVTVYLDCSTPTSATRAPGRQGVRDMYEVPDRSELDLVINEGQTLPGATFEIMTLLEELDFATAR